MDDSDNFSLQYTLADACELGNTSIEPIESGDVTLLSHHNILHGTFDGIRHLLGDDSFSPPRNSVESVESGENKFMTPHNVSSLSDMNGRMMESQHWAKDSDDSTWTTPPLMIPRGQHHRKSLFISRIQDKSRETPPRSNITGTPKRGATSPARGQKTLIKQQKLPPQAEKNVQITPVRDFLENLSTK